MTPLKVLRMRGWRLQGAELAVQLISLISIASDWLKYTKLLADQSHWADGTPHEISQRAIF